MLVTRQRSILFSLSDVLRLRSAAAIGVAVALGIPAMAAQARTEYRFDFGGKAASGFLEVAADDLYNPDRGYGFEPDFPVREVASMGGKPQQDGFATSTKPFFFSVAVAEGNYRVTVTLGDRDGESVTTIKAELRRLMVAKAVTQPGKFLQTSFVVNVRQPDITDNTKVKFKPRETSSEAWAWDNKLTLEFSNAQPKLCELTIQKVDIPTIYIAGDSTSTDQALEPYNSWGQMLPAFFRPNVAIANNGESGETARSFIGEKRWSKVMSVIKPGDWILIQFGHNDQKEKGEGVGAFTTYKATLKRLASEAREHGAKPVLITPMNRRTFDAAGKVTNSLGDFPDAVRQLAHEDNVPLIDLNAMSKTLYEALGLERSGKLFAGRDTTHHSDYGSYELAKCIVLGIEQDRLLIAKYLKGNLPRFDPAHPDPFEQFDIPPDPNFTTMKPYGQ